MSNEISVSIGLTKNLGNYESLRIDASAKKSLADQEDRDGAWNDLWNEVMDQVEAQLNRKD